MLALSKGSPELALSRSTWHYPRVDLDQHRAKLAISKWIWSKFWQSWHYPRVDLGQNWARRALSYMLALSKGGFGPNLGQVGTIQGWIWVKIWQSWHYPRVDLAQNWARRALSYMLALSKGGLGPKVVNPRNYRHFQGWIWSSRLQTLPTLPTP